MKFKNLMLVVALCGLVTACGHDKTDRAISGGAIGAAAGAAGATLMNKDPMTGAAIGGAVGAAAGAATTSEDVDLGRPIWK